VKCWNGIFYEVGHELGLESGSHDADLIDARNFDTYVMNTATLLRNHKILP